MKRELCVCVDLLAKHLGVVHDSIGDRIDTRSLPVRRDQRPLEVQFWR